MKPASRLRIDPFTLSAFLAEAMLWLIEVLENIGASEPLRAWLLNLAVDLRRVLFVRAVAAADIRLRDGAGAQAPLFHKHINISVRAIVRAMCGKHLRNLTRGDDRTRIEALLNAIDHADAIVAAIKARILRRAGRFNRRRLITTPPRKLTLAHKRVLTPAPCADTS